MAKRESLQINELVTPTGQRITFGTAAPTTQLHKVGDTVINTAPAASGVFCWSCTVAGTPGTWVTTVSGQSTTGMPTFPVGIVAAGGSSIGDAVACTTAFNLVSGATGATGVKMPVASTGQTVIVKNNAAAALLLYPQVGSAINALTAGTALSVANLVPVTLVATSATQWYTLPLLPS